MTTIAFLHSILRKEEKLLLNEFQSHSGVEIRRINVKLEKFDLRGNHYADLDLAFERAISHSQGLHAVEILESQGVETINSADIIQTSGDKLLTSLALERNGLPQPEVYLTHDMESAIEISEKLEYPVVYKPLVGSWGRLLAKVNDREAAEAILEHKMTLGSYLHSAIYIQKFIEKKGRDIRAFVIGNQCIAAIYRKSEHWITNTSRGGEAENCPVSEELADISIKAAKAINRRNTPQMLAVDIMETADGYLVNEVNATMEFKNSIETTGVNIPGLICEYVIDNARR